MKSFPLISLALVACSLLPPRANAFAVYAPSQKTGLKLPTRRYHDRSIVAVRSSASDDAAASVVPSDLISTEAFVQAIETLKRDSGVEAAPEEEAEESAASKMYAIGKLTATLPIEHAGGLSLADCGTLVLVNGITKGAADETGIQPLDTVVSMSAKDFAGEVKFGDVRGESLDKVAEVYTKTVEYVIENGFKGIELQVQRLITLRETSSSPEQ